MHTPKTRVICILGVLALASAATLGDQPSLNSLAETLAKRSLAGIATLGDQPPVPPTFTASCILKISLDPAIMPLDPSTVDGLVRSSGVAGKAAHEVLKLPDPQMLREIIDGIEVEWLSDDIVSSASPAPRMLSDVSDVRDTAMDMYGRSSTEHSSASRTTGTTSTSRTTRSATESTPAPGGMGMSGYGGGMGGYGATREREDRRGAAIGGGMSGLSTPRAQAPGVPQSATVRLSVELPDYVEPAAEQFLNALVRNLRDSLVAGAFEGYSSELASLLNRADNQQARAAAELAELSQGGTDPSLVQMDVRDLAAQRRDLVLRIQDIEMSLAAMGARRKAIEQQMARTRVELEHTQQNDEITRELQRILQTNEQLLSSLRTHFEAGRVPEGDTIKAQEGVAKARIELARRREELAKATGGGQLGAFGNELSAMAIDTAESHVRLQMLEQRLAETEAQIKEVSTFDPKATRVRTAREAMEVAERRVIELQRRIANLEPPIVTVIGASSL